MRSLIVLRLGLGLFAGGFAVGSPCKLVPAVTTSESISIVSTTTSLVASVQTTTADVSATSVISESSEETSESSSTEAVSSTTIEPPSLLPPIPTFTLFATGESVVEGDSLHTYDNENSVAVFDPNPVFGSAPVRPYTIDSQGRLINDEGYFLCGYYLATNTALDAPASVSTCLSQRAKSPFLNCELSSDLELQCGIPARSCVFHPNGEPICEETGETWSTWSAGIVFVGHGLMIGPIDTPSNYQQIGVRASLV
ncbi:hypothetical protein FSHL1_007055 [Fusarium sambucinum]